MKKRIGIALIALLLAFAVGLEPICGLAQGYRPAGGIELPDDNWGCPFRDVKSSDYFYAPVLWAVDQNITSGTSRTSFSPNHPCTRAQVVTFLWRAVGEPQPKQTENPFADVTADAYYYYAVLWAVEKGVTSGTSKTTFAPNNPCTRDQVVTFLWRTMGRPEPLDSRNPFSDVSDNAYYYQPVLWAVEKGITSGTSKTTFAPSASCTRGQVVTFLYRALKGK